MTAASVSLAENAHRVIRSLAEAAYPQEGCGVLIGSFAGEGITVHEATSARNLWTERARDRYDMDPADILAADHSARARGLDVVGFWHSHPDHPARPSQFDTDRAWVDYAYIIVNTVSGGSGDLNAFTLEGDGGPFHPAPLTVAAAAP